MCLKSPISILNMSGYVIKIFLEKLIELFAMNGDPDQKFCGVRSGSALFANYAPVICIYRSPSPTPTYGDGRGMTGSMCGVITFWMSPQCPVSDGIMILRQYSGDYSSGTSRRKSVFYVYFTGAMPVFYQSNKTRSHENKMAFTTENESEKSSRNIYTHPIHLSIFSKLKLDNWFG